MSLLLCCQGVFFLLGFAILLLGKVKVWNRTLQGGRGVVVGLLLLAQAPTGFLVGSLLLGDTSPGALDNAPLEDALPRLGAALGEWSILLSVLAICLYLIFCAPQEAQLESNSQ